MLPVITVRPDKYFDDATQRVAQQATVDPGVTAGERDTLNVFVRTTTGWLPISTAGAEHVLAASIIALTGGQSASVAISTASAQSFAITSGSAVVTPTVDCFFRQGSNPTALSNGTDQVLFANNSYRIANITSGNKLAFITGAGTGTVYLSPGG